MPDKQQATQRIHGLIRDENAFIVQLKAFNVFDAEKYAEIKQAFEDYISAIGQDELIDREVAGDLFFHVEVLGDLTLMFQKYDFPNANITARAHYEMWELANTLFSSPLPPTSDEPT